MFDIIRQNPLKAGIVMTIVAIVAIAYLGAVIRYTQSQNDGHIGALLDDTWIHVRFADNIAQGEGLSYNEDELTTGATSPLWVMTLAAAFKVFNPSTLEQINVAIMMSAIAHVISVLAITGFGWYATRHAWVGLVAGLMTAVTGRYIWMGLSGMEITTFTTFCILAIWSHLDDVRDGHSFGWRTGILSALATLARPEGYLLTALIMLDTFVLVPLRADTIRQDSERLTIWSRIRYGWRGIMAYGLLAGSYPLASLLISGYPLPNTFRVKSQLGREFPDLPDAFLWQPNVDFGAIVLILAGLGTVFLIWRAWQNTPKDPFRIGFVWALWGPLLVLGVLFLGADRFVVNNSRYVAPAIPFEALSAVVGVLTVMKLATHYLSKNGNAEQTTNTLIDRYVPIGLSIVLICFAFWMGRGQGAGVANDVYQLRTMHVNAGFWFAENTEPDDLIALNDVGAIVHIADREVLDLEGLVSVDVITATEHTENYTCEHDLALARLMLERQPRFIAVFDWFYPCLTRWRDALQPYTVFTITGPTVIAGGEMIVYTPIWDNWMIYSGLPDDVNTIDADFEQGISLIGYEISVVDAGLEVRLWWSAHNQPSESYHVFVHLIDENNTQISQHDGVPQGNQFQTNWWREGDIIHDTHIIELDDLNVLEEGGLRLRVGLYFPANGLRVPRVAAPIEQNDFALIPLDILD